MIDQERVRDMTKLAAFEEREGKQYRQVTQFFRSDFARRHLLKGFFCGTAAFGTGLLMWAVCHYEQLAGNLDSIDWIAFGIRILVWYLIFMVGYLIAVDIYANVFYAAGRRRMKRYYRRLKHLGKLYEEQEERTAPTRH